jgi:hypothetical protein
MVMIEVLVSSGTDTDRKKGLVAALVEKTWRSRHRPKRHHGKSIVRADHSAAAGSHHLLLSLDQ